MQDIALLLKLLFAFFLCPLLLGAFGGIAWLLDKVRNFPGGYFGLGLIGLVALVLLVGAVKSFVKSMKELWS